MAKYINKDVKDAIADALIEGRIRYAARLIHKWKEKMKQTDVDFICRDVHKETGSEPIWTWNEDKTLVTLEFRGGRYPYRLQDCENELY